jgi:halimadienyl-diphosphate synthase
LAAVLCLSQWSEQKSDRALCERGIRYIWARTPVLAHDPYETVGFELIIPTLMEQARERGFCLPTSSFDDFAEYRRKKLERIPPHLFYAPQNPALYSLEFMGSELDLELVRQGQEANGSVGNSPSATAYLLNQDPDNALGWRYVNQVMRVNSSGAVFSFPLDIFERTWVLYNLDLAGLMGGLGDGCRAHVDYLRETWDPEKGVSFSRWYSAYDLDDTALAFKVLQRAAHIWDAPGYRVSLDVFEAYAETDHFRTFLFETDPSLSSNIHLLDALQISSRPQAKAMRETILAFMRRTRSLEAFWFDKWHASPYYVTAHAILAVLPCDQALIEDAVYWIIHTQRPDGSWGHFAEATVEETAYCLQALAYYAKRGGDVPFKVMQKAAMYLWQHIDDTQHPALWIAKTLFAPLHIIESAIISALALYEQLS